MSSQTVLEAFIKTLKAAAFVSDTGLLPNGTSSIFPMGRVQGQQGSPYLTVGELLSRGSENDAHLTTTIRVRAYFGDNSGKASTLLIHKLVVAVKEAMHKANLGDIDGIGFMDCRWSGYQSADLYDYGTRDYYQEVRFNIHLGHTLA